VIDRRAFVAGMAAVMAAPLRGQAQQGARLYRVGFLGLTTPGTASSTTVDILRRAIRERGWIEEQNLVFELRWAEGRAERLPELARELIGTRPDVLVAGTVPTVRALQASTATIPIVFVALPGPAVAGLVSDIARPSGNVTGFSFQATPQQAAKELEFLRELAPGAARIGVIRDREMGEYVSGYLPYVRDAAATLRVTFHLSEFSNARELESALAAAAKANTDALWVMATPTTFAERHRIATFALKHRLPSLSSFTAYADAGGLATYGASLLAVWRRSAHYVDRLLQGARPSDLPVEQPTQFEFVVNLKTANALSLAIPQSLLLRADEVIQ